MKSDSHGWCSSDLQTQVLVLTATCALPPVQQTKHSYLNNNRRPTSGLLTQNNAESHLLLWDWLQSGDISTKIETAWYFIH